MQNPVGAHQIHAIGSKGQLYGSKTDLYFLPLGFSDPAHIEFQPAHGIPTAVQHFIECIEKKKKPVTDLQQGIDVLDLILRATANQKKKKRSKKSKK